MIEYPAAQTCVPGSTIAQSFLEQCAPSIHQIVPDVCGAWRVQAVRETWTLRAVALGQFDRFVRDLLLIPARGSSQPLDDLAITVARSPVHSGIDVGRIVTQHFLHPADSLEEELPVLDCQTPQTADAVGDNFIIGYRVG